jgi:hypothetical protein
MRTGLLRSVGTLLTAAPLGLAAPTLLAQSPPSLPPAIVTDLPAVPLAAPGTQTQTAPPPPAAAPAQQPPPAPQAAPAAPMSAPAGACGPGAAQPPAAPAWHDEHCGPPERWWLGGGYLLWHVKDGPLPVPLATTGGLGQPGTSVLLGGQDLSYGTFNGIHLDGGLWFDCRHTAGLELGGFILEQRSVSGVVASDANGAFAGGVLARPIIDPLTLTPVGVLAAAPGVLAGTVAFKSTSRFDGAEGNVLYNLFNTPGVTIDAFFGTRYLDLDENLAITQATTALGGNTITFGGSPPPFGTGTTVGSVLLEDRFRTRNQFVGSQFGARAEYRFGAVSVNVRSSVALGPNHEVVEISGQTSAPGAGALPGGLLAVGGGVEAIPGQVPVPGLNLAVRPRGNIGRDTTNRFAVVPQVGAQVGMQVSGHVRLYVGYEFLYINDVVRPGSQIDPVVNPRLVPTSNLFGTTSGSPAPFMTARHDDFYAHGVEIGMEVRY